MSFKAEVTIQKFDVKDKHGIFERWSDWREELEQYFTVNKITDDKEKIANLLLFGGAGISKTYKPLSKDSDAYKDVVTTLNNVFNPKQNIELNRFNFSNINQHEGEDFDDFIDRLNEAIMVCNYPDDFKETVMISQIIRGCRNNSIRSKALSKDKLSLADLTQIGRNVEAIQKSNQAFTRASLISKDESDEEPLETTSSAKIKQEAQINRVSNNFRPQRANYSSPQPNNYKNNSCYKCGSEHGVDACPAKGRTCNNCGKQNHFAKVCRQSTRKQQKPRIQFVNQNNLNESSSSGSIWIVKQAKAAINYLSKFFMPFVAIFLSQTWINICVDTGAQANIMDEKTFNQLKLKPKLYKTSVKLYRYNDTRPIELLGEFKTRVMYNNQYRSVTFIVVKGNAGNLLNLE